MAGALFRELRVVVRLAEGVTSPDAEDEDVEGVYAISVNAEFSDNEAAVAALNTLHEQIGIGRLEDYAIRVFDKMTGLEIKTGGLDAEIDGTYFGRVNFERFDIYRAKLRAVTVFGREIHAPVGDKAIEVLANSEAQAVERIRAAILQRAPGSTNIQFDIERPDEHRNQGISHPPRV
jgi:hypothetical protein